MGSACMSDFDFTAFARAKLGTMDLSRIQILSSMRDPYYDVASNKCNLVFSKASIRVPWGQQDLDCEAHGE